MYLRMVHDLCTTQEIAFKTGESETTIDGQIKKAYQKIGASGRTEAARRLHGYELRIAQDQFLDPRGPESGSRLSNPWPLPWPVPSRFGTLNIMSRQQVVIWGAIITIGIPMGMTVVAMLILAIALLLGAHV